MWCTRGLLLLAALTAACENGAPSAGARAAAAQAPASAATPASGTSSATAASAADRAAATPSAGARDDDTHTGYIGGAACAGCHAAAAAAWAGSHHDLAMQPATPDTVLADFTAPARTGGGRETHFFMRGDQYWVRAEGEDGAPATFRITHTFGVAPLQQYLAELPGGRLQALTIAWDSRPAAAGGQRWFDIYAEASPSARSPLHWTGTLHNWNGNCAYCHSTDLEKALQPDGSTYRTNYASIDVDCEACHGPGARHVAAPEASSMLLPAAGAAARWVFADGASIAHREPPRTSRAEVENCGRCHARRAQLSEAPQPGAALLDGFRPALLDDGLYHADGQILDEVYVYGSFLQSAMYRAGVTCSDCHDPHTAALRADADQVCARCHRSEVFAVPAHHHHEAGGAGARCVDCHMPAKSYMVVDPRRDHSFRVPRPDLSESIGVPNACTGCHEARTDAWAAQIVAEWFPEGRTGAAHYGEAISAGRTWSADRASRLATLAGDSSAPAIARATAVDLLAEQMDGAAFEVIRGALRTDKPLIQLAALEALGAVPGPYRTQAAAPFLSHPLRALRTAAARVLVPVRDQLEPAIRGQWERAIEDYRAVQRFNADRAEGLANLAGLAAQTGDTGTAMALLATAIAREPGSAAAYVNLAELQRARGREALSTDTLRDAVRASPEDAGAHFALGLALVRAGEREAALASLRRAVDLAPRTPHYRYVVGVALNGMGDAQGARRYLRDAHERFPGHRDTLLALTTFYRDEQDFRGALHYARKLRALSPGDRGARSLVRELETAAGQSR